MSEDSVEKTGLRKAVVEFGDKESAVADESFQDISEYIDRLHQLRLREPRHRVSRKAISLWTLEAVLGWTTLLVPQAVGLFFFRSSWQFAAFAVTLVVSTVHGMVMPRWRYRVHRWESTDDAVYTLSGWLTLERSIVPVSRVQAVNVDQGLLQRLLGLAMVSVRTASVSGSVHIDGLDYHDAVRLADDLAVITQVTPGDAT